MKRDPLNIAKLLLAVAAGLVLVYDIRFVMLGLVDGKGHIPFLIPFVFMAFAGIIHGIQWAEMHAEQDTDENRWR